MFRLILSVTLLGCSLLVGGCASEEAKSPTATENISTMPWNRPQPGEGAMMGGMLNTH
jgi:hypothetical protein